MGHNKIVIPTGVVMGLWPTQGDEKRLGPATTLYGTVALSFVIPSEAEGSAVPRTFRGYVFRQSVPGFPATLHWTRPRMRLSFKERRMMFANATKLYRKSGVAWWRDLRFHFRSQLKLSLISQPMKIDEV
jgi:hypothetical protein